MLTKGKEILRPQEIAHHVIILRLPHPPQIHYTSFSALLRDQGNWPLLIATPGILTLGPDGFGYQKTPAGWSRGICTPASAYLPHPTTVAAAPWLEHSLGHRKSPPLFLQAWRWSQLPLLLALGASPPIWGFPESPVFTSSNHSFLKCSSGHPLLTRILTDTMVFWNYKVQSLENIWVKFVFSKGPQSGWQHQCPTFTK